MEIKKILVVGGGSAGWLTAAILANKFLNEIQVELIESPDIATIGVGEGTWPSMRTTLQKIGVSEAEFMEACDVSLKQGTKFIDWCDGQGEHYYHPFSLPSQYGEFDLSRRWSEVSNQSSFAHAVSPQPSLCDLNLAPKQQQTPEFAFAVNYGYHLNAGKFGDFLKRHCVDNLAVRHKVDHVTNVVLNPNGEIETLLTKNHGSLRADLYIDCTGMKGLLIGDSLSSEFQSVEHVLFNNTAIAAQVRYPNADTPISSTTSSMAKPAGWIWDIGLSSRRGVGYVFSSDFLDSDAAERTLREYINNQAGLLDDQSIDCREIKFRPGYRPESWNKNCVAIGLSAGFVEPLEASALVMVERMASAVADQLPPRRDLMPVAARRFNQRFKDHWERIIEFLKLHYVLSRRNEPYWQAHRETDSIPSNLSELLSLWQYRVPSLADAPHYDELFPAASYQYILSGMGFTTKSNEVVNAKLVDRAKRLITDNSVRTTQMSKHMPTNRELLKQIYKSGFIPNGQP